jgi:hypothetical protein
MPCPGLQGAQLYLIFLACSLVRWGMTMSSIVTHAKWMIEFVFHAILVVRCQ